MDIRARIFVAALSIGLLIFVINLVRRKYLEENYAVLWVITAVGLSLIPLIINYLDQVAYWIGIYYPPTFVNVVAIMFLIILILHFSVIISNLSEQNKNLIQDLGILEKKVNDLETQLLRNHTHNSEYEKEVELLGKKNELFEDLKQKLVD